MVKRCGTPAGPPALENGGTSVPATVNSKTHVPTTGLKLLLYHGRGVSEIAHTSRAR